MGTDFREAFLIVLQRITDPQRRNKLTIRGEIAIKGGTHPGEIRVVFVPADKIEFVKKLLSENGHSTLAVEPIPPSQPSRVN